MILFVFSDENERFREIGGTDFRAILSYKKIITEAQDCKIF